ncbi:ATP-dependent Clp protease adaptor ClpS [Oceanirhabdus seepicola]|uniref:ATP-dependent Clp protease adapter protein ClpS n=1 Tax=Oceanirhabdus seepicola TaxID=2828781 RepID=A0A9J6NZ65_9CLOT|nr:ATP-dependent Clp protease adaptor ClpS [Oceanirhabdus seepicola]MCM1988424.1 ATP-dependent Clp protease adaptor ClpS [Oceanirhabdus seepicola]
MNECGNVKSKSDIKIKMPKKYKVIMHNDDYTSMEFVIEVLVKIFGKSVPEATKIMYEVHENGHGIAGIYSFDIAKTKALEAMSIAEGEGLPFNLTVEEE